MTQKFKKHDASQEDETLTTSNTESSCKKYSIALYMQSFIVIAVVGLMFVITCWIFSQIMDYLLPLIKIAAVLCFAYALFISAHFHDFRQSLFNSEHGPVRLWNDFTKGCHAIFAQYLDKNWLRKM
jgi:hypothetical protein